MKVGVFIQSFFVRGLGVTGSDLSPFFFGLGVRDLSAPPLSPSPPFPGFLSPSFFFLSLSDSGSLDGGEPLPLFLPCIFSSVSPFSPSFLLLLLSLFRAGEGERDQDKDRPVLWILPRPRFFKQDFPFSPSKPTPFGLSSEEMCDTGLWVLLLAFVELRVLLVVSSALIQSSSV